MSAVFVPDRTPTYQRYKSPLGVLWRKPFKQVYVMVFTAHDLLYELDPSLYASHLQEWDARVTIRGLPRWGCALCHVKDDVEEDYLTIIPDGYAVPDGMTYIQLEAEPSHEDIKTAYLNAYVGSDPFPPGVLMIYDSGISAQVLAGINAFAPWLEARSVSYQIGAFGGWKWLRNVYLGTYMEKYGSFPFFDSWYEYIAFAIGGGP